MKQWIYLDGRFVPPHEARVSVFDHGLLYGDGVFEGIRIYVGRVFKLREHVERIYDSAKALMLEIPLDREELERVVVETVRRNALQDGYVRLVVTRGEGDLGLDPRNCPKPTVFVIADEITLFPQELYTRGMRVVTVATRRMNVDALNPRIKSLNYLNNIVAKVEANLLGYAEVVMLNADGFVVEGTGDNIFIVKNRRLATPPAYLGILEGITRNTVMDLARQAGYAVEEKVFTRHELYIADECFLTGTAAEIVPVVEVDGRRVGAGAPGPATLELMRRFRVLAATQGTEVYPERLAKRKGAEGITGVV